MLMTDIKLLVKYIITFCLGTIIILYFIYEMIIQLYIMKYNAFQPSRYSYYLCKYIFTYFKIKVSLNNEIIINRNFINLI